MMGAGYFGGAIKVKDKKKFKCPTCDETFSDYDEAKQHSWYCGDKDDTN